MVVPFMTDVKGTQPDVAPSLGVKMSPKHKGPCQWQGCLQVDTVWRSPSDFRRHWAGHDPSYREHVCGDCAANNIAKWFTQKSHLTTHINTKHSDIKNFACKCGVENVDAAVIYRHVDPHEGDTSQHDWSRYGDKTRPGSLHSARDLSKGAAGIRHAHFDARRAAKAATRQEQQQQQQPTPPATPAQPVEQFDLPAFVPQSQVATDPNAGLAIDPALGYNNWAHEPITQESEFYAMAAHRLGEYNATYDAAHSAQTDRNLAALEQHRQDVREQLATAPALAGPAWDNLVPEQPVAPEQPLGLGQAVAPAQAVVPADQVAMTWEDFQAWIENRHQGSQLAQQQATTGDDLLMLGNFDFSNIDPSVFEAGEFGADAYSDLFAMSQ